MKNFIILIFISCTTISVAQTTINLTETGVITSYQEVETGFLSASVSPSTLSGASNGQVMELSRTIAPGSYINDSVVFQLNNTVSSSVGIDTLFVDIEIDMKTPFSSSISVLCDGLSPRVFYLFNFSGGIKTQTLSNIPVLEGMRTITFQTPSDDISLDRFRIITKDVVTNPQDDLLAQKVKILSNPIVDFLIIEGVVVDKVTVINSQGEMIVSSSSHKIDLSALPTGLYYSIIETSEGTITKKVVKK